MAFLGRLLAVACTGVLAPSAGAQVEMRSVVIEGSVLDARGFPVGGAVVVSSAGGSAVSESDGWFHLEVAQCPWGAIIEVTGAASEGGRTATGRVRVTPTAPTWNLGSLYLQAGGGCWPSWRPTFGGEPVINGSVQALTVFDDGGGPALYVGGAFTTVGGVAAKNLAKWDGSTWSTLKGGVKGEVHALAVFDDGSGPALYAGGEFMTAGGVAAKRIAKWDGSSWSPLGSGMAGGFDPRVLALAVFDDGSGPALYAGGAFTTAGGVPASGMRDGTARAGRRWEVG